MFTYKGISSKEMHLRVLNDVLFASPTRDVNMIQVPGRDGDLVMDNGRYNSVIRSIPCRLEAPSHTNVEDLINQINNWLVSDAKFHEFEWENDADFKYLARVEGDVISQRVLSRFGKTTVDFRLHPIKYLKSMLTPRQIATGTSIFNQFNVEAKPLIRLVGSGNITINIGGRSLTLERIGSGCIIDSETQTITDLQGRVTLFESMCSSFPVLKPGNNQITFDRNDIGVYVTPRLGALV